MKKKRFTAAVAQPGPRLLPVHQPSHKKIKAHRLLGCELAAVFYLVGSNKLTLEGAQIKNRRLIRTRDSGPFCTHQQQQQQQGMCC